MAELGLQIKQTQNMVMTPQMQQSIKMLQLATIDLVPYLYQQMEINPFLEDAENVPESDAADGGVEEMGGEGEAPISEDGAPSAIDASEKKEVSWSDDEISPAVYEGDSLYYSGSGGGGSNNFADNTLNFEETQSEKESLRDHILDQINIDVKDPIQKIIAVYLTDMIDENGYINADLQHYADTLKCDLSDIEDTLLILQKFSPAGIFARNLSECLKIQLRDKNRLDPAMEKLLDNLDLFAKRDFKALCRICEVDEEDIIQMCHEVRALNPKPGNVFTSDHIQVIQPDVFLKRPEKGKWMLELNSEALPKVIVNRRYYSHIENIAKDKESKKFLSEQYGNANWLVKALDQRANTILKVATEIVLKQDEFFKNGISHLKPLVLSDIAQSIDMHESTVSRVINGKYIATHMGMFELKYFFSSAIASSDGGEDISSKSIKFMIKELIDKEDPKKILSDDKIASILKAKGVDIARRTVMKYREAMDIASSVQRRKEKSLR